MRPDEKFKTLIPKKGWFKNYIDYTDWSEGPAVFQFFVGATILGAALGRRVKFSKGYYNLYPDMKVLIVAPTGKCRKSSTCNIGIGLLQKILDINIIADKTTPEGLLDSLVTPPITTPDRVAVAPDAVAIIYASELAVMLGKQKYNEGMIMLLTSLFDSPDEFKTRTKGGGEIKLKNIALSFLGASTPDWLVSAIPQDAFGGGFMSRILFVVQEDTPRCYPIPDPPEGKERMIAQLQHLVNSAPSILTFDKEATMWFNMWYSASKKKITEDTKMSGYQERKPDHLVRLAMLLAIGVQDKIITTEHLKQSSHILDYLEKEMLYTFKWLGMRPIGQDQERIVRTLKAMGGKASHNDLLRKLVFYMNAFQFKNSMETLLESKIVRDEFVNSVRMYFYLGGE
jgi:hypothetical protein